VADLLGEAGSFRQEFEKVGIDLVDLAAEVLEGHGVPFVARMG
jgi:hypothetical protein